MGDSIEQWRATIGQWMGGRPRKCVTLQHCTAQTSNHIGYRPIRFLVLVSLLVIGCVELNPGPDHVSSVIRSNKHLGRFWWEHYETWMKQETTSKLLNKTYHGKTLHGSHTHIYKSKPSLKINGPTGRLTVNWDVCLRLQFMVGNFDTNLNYIRVWQEQESITLAEPLSSTHAGLYRQQYLWLFKYAVFLPEHLASYTNIS